MKMDDKTRETITKLCVNFTKGNPDLKIAKQIVLNCIDTKDDLVIEKYIASDNIPRPYKLKESINKITFHFTKEEVNHLL